MVDQIPKQTVTKDNIQGVLAALQDSAATSVRQITDSPILNCVLVQATLSTTATLVAHNLGYVPRGFFVVKSTSFFDTAEDTAVSNPDSRKYIALKVSAGTQSVSLIIF